MSPEMVQLKQLQIQDQTSKHHQSSGTTAMNKDGEFMGEQSRDTWTSLSFSQTLDLEKQILS
jgi:hypothetical protein